MAALRKKRALQLLFTRRTRCDLFAGRGVARFLFSAAVAGDIRRDMTEPRIEIRRAVPDDANVLAHHRISMFRDMGSAAPDIEQELRDAAAAQMREAMRTGEYVAWVAHPEGEHARIVGGAGVQLRRLFARPHPNGASVLLGRDGIVLNVYVERGYRRRGIARALMESILAWVPETDIVSLVLHASKEGRPLYESMGFEPTNEMRYARDLRPAAQPSE
jgi:GNAT superfamily N-acetyltransferase